MNAKGVEVLTKAALDGVRQIRGAFKDANGGRCALGVLADAIGCHTTENILSEGTRLQMEYGLTGAHKCQECGELASGHGIVAHMNDEHGLDFIGIARKLGPDA